MELIINTLCSRRDIKVCQKTVPNVTDQRTDRADHQNNDPPGGNVVQNPNLQMGFVNQAVSNEMANDSGYMRLQRPFDGYDKLVRDTGLVGVHGTPV